MPGRTLREAIAVALEAFPPAALHDEVMLDAVHAAVADWMRDYGARLGVVFHDGDGVLDEEINQVIAVARTKTPNARRCPSCHGTGATAEESGERLSGRCASCHGTGIVT